MPPDSVPSRAARSSSAATRRWLVAGAVVLTAVVFTPLALVRIDPHHDGIMLKTALDVLSGQRLFRDTFTQYGALTTYVHVAALWAFGARLVVLKLVTVAAYALSAGALTALWARLLPAALVPGSVAIWLLLAPFYGVVWPVQPWSSAVALSFQALSLLAFAHAIETPRFRAPALASGMCAALTVWARTPVGVLHTAALVAGFAYAGCVERRRALWGAFGWFVSGALVTHLAFLAVLVRQDTIGPWLEQTFVGPATWARTKGTSLGEVFAQLFPGTGSLVRLDSFVRWQTWRSAEAAVGLVGGGVVALACLRPRDWGAGALVVLAIAAAAVAGGAMLADPFLLTTAQALALAIPSAALVVVGDGLVRLVRRVPGEPGPACAVALALAVLASWLQYFPTSDPQHVFWAAAPGAGLLLYALWTLVGRRSAPVLVLAGVLLLPLAVAKALDARALFADDWVRVERVPVLAGLRASPGDAEEYARLYAILDDYGRRWPDTPMAIVGTNALVATFAPSLRNPGPYFVQWASGMRLAADDLRRFVTARRALILIDPPHAGVAARLSHDLGYRELVRTSNRIIIAPAE